MTRAPALQIADIAPAVLAALAGYRLTPAQIAALPKPVPNPEQGLITIEPAGVHANPTAFWWWRTYPFHVLSILALLDVPLLNGGEVADWIKRQQHPDGYFRPDRLGHTVRQATYHACVMLRLLDAQANSAGWDRYRLIDLLQSQYQPGARVPFARLPRDRKDPNSEFEVILACVASLGALGDHLADADAALRYLATRQEPAGTFRPRGWANTPDAPREAPTAAAVRSFLLLGADPPHAARCAATIQGWQLVDGGFDAVFAQYPAYPQISHLVATARAVLTLDLLGSAPVDRESCIRRILQFWSPSGGFFADSLPVPAGGPDPSTLRATHHGLLALAALGMLQPAPERLPELLLYSDLG